MSEQRRIRVGIGGWNYEPWRKTFYPRSVAKNDELAYASNKVTAIEINSTFYRLQKPAVFAKWRAATPDRFMFSLKAPRFVTQRKALSEAGPHLRRFFDSGITELGSKLCPLLWQLDAKHTFDADDIQRFLDLLPGEAHGARLRHAIEVRHQSFATPRFLEIARERAVTVVLEDDEDYPGFADVTGSLIYARLRRNKSSEPTGYPPAAITDWAERARTWASGDEPDDLPRVERMKPVKSAPRDVFIYFINGAKERAPAAAMSLIEALHGQRAERPTASSTTS